MLGKASAQISLKLFSRRALALDAWVLKQNGCLLRLGQFSELTQLDLPEGWCVWEPERFLKIRLRGTKWVGHKKRGPPTAPSERLDDASLRLRYISQ